jgi:hypothetical protein
MKRQLFAGRYRETGIFGRGRRSELWFWRGEFAGFDGVGEAAGFVGAVAERFVLGLAATAEAQSGAAAESEGASFGVD